MNVTPLTAKGRISVMWAPGYTNTKGRDMVDVLAKQCADMDFIEPEPFFGASSIRNFNTGSKRNGHLMQGNTWANISDDIYQLLVK